MAGLTFNGPRELTDAELHGLDGSYERGWLWKVSLDDEWERPMLVLVASGRGAEEGLPRECRDAIDSKGRTAVEAAFEVVNPPYRIVVTSAELKWLWEPPPEGMGSALGA